MVKLKYQDHEYLLDFDRATVETLEKLGFSFNEFSNKMATMQPILFRGAFLKNHKFEKNIKYDEIWQNVKNKKGLTDALIEMVADTYMTLMSDENDNDEGNQNWEVM